MPRTQPILVDSPSRSSVIENATKSKGPTPVVTVGSVPRDRAELRFPFLAEHFPGRRNAIRELTHRDPEFVFWIYPDGRLHDARRSHRDNVPKGYEHILRDEPDYAGFLRGRIVRCDGHQLIVVYCRPLTLETPGKAVEQFIRGMEQMPVPVEDEALVISDNADIFGTVADLWQSPYPALGGEFHS